MFKLKGGGGGDFYSELGRCGWELKTRSSFLLGLTLPKFFFLDCALELQLFCGRLSSKLPG